MGRLTGRTGTEWAAKSLGATRLAGLHGVQRRGRQAVAARGAGRGAVEAQDVRTL